MKSLLLALLVAAGPAMAGGLTDLIMAPGVLADIPAGEVVRYDHHRHLGAAAPADPVPGMIAPRPIGDGTVTLTSDGAGLTLVRTEDGKAMPPSEFPAAGPNPVLLFFMENVVRNMAAETGGSPFYIRNRIREALATADIVGESRETVSLHPFATDPNAGRMGAFASLTLSVTLRSDQPGRLIALRAATDAGAAGYTEDLLLVGGE